MSDLRVGHFFLFGPPGFRSTRPALSVQHYPPGFHSARPAPSARHYPSGAIRRNSPFPARIRRTSRQPPVGGGTQTDSPRTEPDRTRAGTRFGVELRPQDAAPDSLLIHIWLCRIGKPGPRFLSGFIKLDVKMKNCQTRPPAPVAPFSHRLSLRPCPAEDARPAIKKGRSHRF